MEPADLMATWPQPEGESPSAEVDAYGIPLTSRWDIAFVQQWMDYCRHLFETRYADFPAHVRDDVTKFWPPIWTNCPMKGHAVVLQARVVEETRGGIVVPANYQRPPSWGWVMAISPQLLEERTWERGASGKFFDHPLDYVGRAFTWGEYCGTPLRDSTYSRSFEGLYLQMRVDDLLAHLTTILPPEA